MRISFLTLLICLILNLGVDFYLFRALMSDLRRQIWSHIQFWSACVLNSGLIVLMFLPFNSLSDGTIRVLMWILFLYISIYLAKYIFVFFDILSRLPSLWHKKRAKWVSLVGVALGVLIFFMMWWGALVTRYTIDVREVEVKIDNLPASFNGMRAVHISDLHVGTYGDDTTYVSKLVDRINALDPDVIFFTGDIVNRNAEELRAFVPVLSRLKAEVGIFSILGNHDYGDYETWPDEAAKTANLDTLVSLQERMGWRLLRNKTEWLVKDNDSIAVIGVENVGDPPFHTYGDMSKAYPDVKDSHTKILLSHNPAHWHKDVRDSENNIALTLAGHTHAMQFELFGLSPIALRYPEWGGLYKDDSGKHQIYVNVGIGTVGFPARIGSAAPEVTLITLRNGE